MIDLVAAVALQFAANDTRRTLLPALKPLLRYPIANPHDTRVLAAAALPHIPRQVYEFLVTHEHLQE